MLICQEPFHAQGRSAREHESFDEAPTRSMLVGSLGVPSGLRRRSRAFFAHHSHNRPMATARPRISSLARPLIWKGLNWSGRRGSNPRPTAWKAVTLPLSYSRLLPHSGGFAPGPPTRSLKAALLGLPSEAASAASVQRRMVAREGLEPSKPLGRQIYSLLRLTASLPRQRCVLLESVCSTRTLRTA